jgi:hypothetical protein
MAKEHVCTLMCGLTMSVMFFKYFDVFEMEYATWITIGSSCYLPRVRN